jgi:ABC-type uncharacterized transport system YnjBCD ATPase subunit
MGMLFQFGALFTDMSVFDNVAFPLREHTTLSEDLIRDIVLMKLDAVGLRGARDLKPSEISGGMSRRVALARAIALDPDDAISLNNLGLLEEQAGFFHQARERFAAADALSSLLEETGIPTEPQAPIAADATAEGSGSVWGWMRHAVFTAEGRSEFAAFVRSGLTFRR